MKVLPVNFDYSLSQINKTNNLQYSKPIQNTEVIDTVSFGKEPYRGITNKRQRMIMANLIIHGAAGVAAATSASMSQVPGSDEIPLSAITTTMVGGLMKGCYGIPVYGSLCTSAAACAIGFRLGTGWWRHCISWIPLIGNGINGATTFTLHEATGWTIVAICEKLMENGQLNSTTKISMSDLKKMRDAAQNLRKEYGKEPPKDAKLPQQIAFKGANDKESHIINKYKNIINKCDIAKRNQKDFSALVNEICDLYSINKESKTAKEINKFFGKLISHLDKNVLKADHPPVMLSDDEMVDQSLELHYWLLLSLLDKQKKAGVDISNLKITDKSFKDKDIQNMAFKRLNKNNI